MSHYQLLPDLSAEEFDALKEDIRLRGIQVPIEFDEQGNVLDGHHRLRAWKEIKAEKNGKTPDYPSIIRVGMDEEEKAEHILSLNLDRRHLTRDQRKELVVALRKRGWSLRRIGNRLGVAVSTVHDDQSGVRNRTPDALCSTVEGTDGKRYPSVIAKGRREAERAFEVTRDAPPGLLPNATVDVKRADRLAKERAAEEARHAPAKEVLVPEPCTIIHGDFRKDCDDIPDNSVDLVFTDPPYDRESIPLYGDLAALGNRVLKPGGSLLAYAGHYALPDIFALMTPHLRYWWLCAVRHSGGLSSLPGKKVYVHWKPIVWFVKESHQCDSYAFDMVDQEGVVWDGVESTRPDKEAHEWQQSTKESGYYISRLSPEGGTVLDPMCGSGTTIIAAHECGRRAVGVEIDKGRHDRAREHIAECCTEITMTSKPSSSQDT